jgi:hypothetical protein
MYGTTPSSVARLLPRVALSERALEVLRTEW